MWKEVQRLIDANALMARLVRKKAGPANRRYAEGYNDAISVCRSMVHSAKTVPIVRCRDCKYRFRNNGHDKNGCPITDAAIWMGDDDFCSHGDRKEGAERCQTTCF